MGQDSSTILELNKCLVVKKKKKNLGHEILAPPLLKPSQKEKKKEIERYITYLVTIFENYF